MRGSARSWFTLATIAVLFAFVFGSLGAIPGLGHASRASAAGASLALVTAPSPRSIQGGKSITAKVQLTADAPAGGAKVRLSVPSGSPLTVPSSVTVAAGARFASFTVTSKRVVLTVDVPITAKYAGVTKMVRITVNGPPAALASVTMDEAVGVAGGRYTGTVTLKRPAPMLIFVQITSDNPAVLPPKRVAIAAGETEATFSITVSLKVDKKAATVTASFQGKTVSTPWELKKAAS